MGYVNNATDAVTDTIIRKIQSGEWVPGMKIMTEEQFVNELGVSRIAVRQAIERLSAISLLHKVQGSGTYVNSFENSSLQAMAYYPATLDRFLTVLEYRKEFDSSNARLFVEHATSEELEQLRKNYVTMVNSKDKQNEFQILENDFHMMIARGTHNAIIQQISTLLDQLLKRYQMLQYENIGPENSIKWHGRILEALESKDAEMAELCVKVHIENSIKYLTEKDNQIHL